MPRAPWDQRTSVLRDAAHARRTNDTTARAAASDERDQNMVSRASAISTKLSSLAFGSVTAAGRLFSELFSRIEESGHVSPTVVKSSFCAVVSDGE